jgi:2-C-methyl-D-erythritol 2,4-cyclodiphosphate synthase
VGLFCFGACWVFVFIWCVLLFIGALVFGVASVCCCAAWVAYVKMHGMTAQPFRIGEGWDIHALVPERPLILGGVQIAHTHGLKGHSDADALLHAMTDALLGAAALGDIGQLFPDTDPTYAGADSLVLLAKAYARVQQAGWQLGNLDSTIVAQAPKMAPHIPAMRAQVAKVLGVDIACVNIKAKTAERMGPVGEGQAIEARAVCLLMAATTPD